MTGKSMMSPTALLGTMSILLVVSIIVLLTKEKSDLMIVKSVMFEMSMIALMILMSVMSEMFITLLITLMSHLCNVPYLY